MLADRFEKEDFDRYQKDLKKFLKDPKYLRRGRARRPRRRSSNDLRNGTAAQRRDCGDQLWRFYTDYLKITPDIPAETEDVLKHMVERLLADGYEGVLLILDEVSLFMKSRKGAAARRRRKDARGAFQPSRQAPRPAAVDHLLGPAGHRVEDGREEHHRQRPAEDGAAAERRDRTTTTSC